jgi:hypothetical protein
MTGTTFKKSALWLILERSLTAGVAKNGTMAQRLKGFKSFAGCKDYDFILI